MRSATVLKSLQVDGGAPLLDADWNMIDPRRIGAIAGGRWYVWNLEGSLTQPETGTTCFGGATRIKWSPSSRDKFSTSGMNIVEVWDVLHIQAPQLYRQESAVGSISWLALGDCVLSTGAKKLYLWPVGL